MGIYSNHIFPRLLEWALGNRDSQEQRKITLARASGKVLEIGFGTGLNLPFYPANISSLTALDSENFLPDLVQRRIALAPFKVERVQLDAGGKIPFEDHCFETVVTTWTLCSIANVDGALSEIRRVLKPDGKYLFCEHGRSDDEKTAQWQDRLNPVQKIIGCGCNMNRPIDRIVNNSGLKIAELERYLIKDAPRMLGEMYRGLAQPYRGDE